MSVRVMADVWDVGPDDAVDCSVLLALANHCDDRGMSCFPSVQTIARMARRSQKTVERSLQTLESGEWITIKRGGGRGVFSMYTVNVAMLKRRQADALFVEEKGRLSRPEKATPAPEKATPTVPYKEDPSCTHQRTINTPLTPASGGGMRLVSGTPREEVTRKAEDENRPDEADVASLPEAGGRELAGVGEAEWSSAKRVAALMTASLAVLMACGVTEDDRLLTAIEGALEAHSKRTGCTLKLAQMLAIENVKAYIQDAPLLRFKWGWKKFFREGYWQEARLWPYDKQDLQKVRRRL